MNIHIEGADLSELHTAYKHWLGEPTRVLRFRKEVVAQNIPTTMDVLFFQSPSTGGHPKSNFVTYIATIGMSTIALQGPAERVELIIRVDGYFEQEVLDELGQSLGELAILPFREPTYLQPDIILCNIKLSLFHHMTCVLLTNWVISSPKWLETSRYPVLILLVNPIYKNEVPIIQQIGSAQSYRLFFNSGLSWYLPNRNSLITK